MFGQLLPAVRMLIVLSVLTGIVYPYLVTGIAQLAFHGAANGSLIVNNTNPWDRASSVSHSTIRNTSGAGRRRRRPSRTTPRHRADRIRVRAIRRSPTAVTARIKALRDADPDSRSPVPVDLVTASGSGLDPDISVAAAEYQIHRVAKARGMPEDKVRAQVTEYTTGRTFGILGEPRVNVLKLNLALDRAGR